MIALLINFTLIIGITASQDARTTQNETKGECPVGSEKISKVGNKLFCVFKKDVEWWVFSWTCNSNDFQTATIDNDEELEALKSFARNGVNGQKPYWIGGHRGYVHQKTDTAIYLWLSTFFVIEYSLWNPDATFKYDGVQLFPYDSNGLGGLTSASLDSTAYSICQKTI